MNSYELYINIKKYIFDHYCFKRVEEKREEDTVLVHIIHKANLLKLLEHFNINIMTLITILDEYVNHWEIGPYLYYKQDKSFVEIQTYRGKSIDRAIISLPNDFDPDSPAEKIIEENLKKQFGPIDQNINNYCNDFKVTESCSIGNSAIRCTLERIGS